MSTWNAFVAIKKAQKSPISRGGMKTMALEYKETIDFQRDQLEAQAKQLEQTREGPSFAQDSEARLKKWREDMYNQARIYCVVMYASDRALSRTKPATMSNTDVGEGFLKAISKKFFNNIALHYKFNLFVAQNGVMKTVTEGKIKNVNDMDLTNKQKSADEIEESQADWKKRIPMEFKAKLELTLGPLKDIPWTALASEKGCLNYRCQFDEYARNGHLDLVKIVNDEDQ
ncbi:hypothetical protein G6F56_012097 [Rhizopus delemar]|nr:hypothetical protein G6F56_012097 [Rhizopus delemar]